MPSTRVAAPVVEHGDLGARHHRVPVHRRLAVAPDERAADEVRGVGDARAIVPGPAHHVAALDRLQRAERRRAMRRDEVAVLAEQFDLRLLRPMRGDLERMRGGERQAPADPRMAARDFQHHPVEGREIELVTAEQPRLGRAVEPGLEERLVQFLGIRAALVVLVLLRAQPRPERRRPRDHLLRRQFRLRHRNDDPQRRLGLGAHRASISRARRP